MTIKNILKRLDNYTGITRDKKLVIVIGTKKAMAIRNDKTESRYTYFGERLEVQDVDVLA